MAKYPILHPEGATVFLTREQWRLLSRLTQALDRLPAVDTWLISDIIPRATRTERVNVRVLARYGVLEQSKAGYQLPARIRAQVLSQAAAVVPRQGLRSIQKA